MSRYDGLIIPRSYSEYLNKTDSATLSQMLQHLTGLWSHAVSAGDNKPVTSDAVYEALTDAATIQQALQLPGVLSGAVAAGDNKPVTSDAVYEALTDAATIQQALQLPGVLSGAVAAGDNKAVTSNAVNSALGEYQKTQTYSVHTDGGTVSIDLRNSPNLYFVCWGYDTYENSAFVQYSYDWRGPRAKLIILKEEEKWIPAPKTEIKDNKLVITHQFGDGTGMLVFSLG